MVHNLGAGHHWSTNTGTVLGGKDNVETSDSQAQEGLAGVFSDKAKISEQGQRDHLDSRQAWFLYLVAIMDWATRKVLSWRLSNTLDASFCIERLWRSLKQEAIYLNEITNGFDAKRIIKEWIGFYISKRPHTALEIRTSDQGFCAGEKEKKRYVQLMNTSWQRR